MEAVRRAPFAGPGCSGPLEVVWIVATASLNCALIEDRALPVCRGPKVASVQLEVNHPLPH
jgi:hypothetical protein